MPRDSQTSPFTQVQRSQGLEARVQRFLSALETTVIELVEAVTPIRQPGLWTGALFLTTWADAGGGQFRAQYRLNGLSEVAMRGALSKPTPPAANEVIFVLPQGLRPRALVTFCAATLPAGQALISISTLGEVRFLSGNYTGISLDQIRFSLEAA